MPGRGWGRSSTLLSCALGLIALVGAARLSGLRLNLTRSLPVGLYRVTQGPAVRGAIVLVCLPPTLAEVARERGYVPHGGSCPGGVMPVGKPVFAVAGDTVTVTPAGLQVNGVPAVNSKALASDRHGRSLPQMSTGRYVVRPGELWLLSEYSRFSFDSRYFGAVQAAAVRARVEFLWVPSTDGGVR